MILTTEQQTYFKDRLNPVVVALVGEELSEGWWDSPNKAFYNKTPNQVVGTSEFNHVKDYLMFHAFAGGGS